ncbi:MAG: NHL repeat-containing protein [Candidatus Riflebacteria bacterium]|nr:NHL repeat-containing protein [Candidatus Riflebacteria bacterium]
MTFVKISKRYLFLVLVAGFILSTSAAFSSKRLQSYSGIFPSDAVPETQYSYLLLIDNPCRVKFSFRDKEGKELKKVKLIEVNLSSKNSGNIANMSGITEADLSEPGIYELKVAPIAAPDSAKPEIRFSLDVDQIAEISGTSSVPSESASSLPTSTQASSSEPPSIKISPVVSVKPDVVPDTIVSSAPAPIASEPVASVNTSVSTESSSLADQNGLKASADQNNVVSEKTSSAFSVLSHYPPEGAFIDPYKPVEITFDRPLQEGLSLESIIKVFRKGSGNVSYPLQGTVFQSSDSTLSFIPKRFSSGVVYYVEVFNTDEKKIISTFSFRTIPRVNIEIKKADDGLEIDLNWPLNPEFLTNETGQVTRLINSKLSISGLEGEILAFEMNQSTPPIVAGDGYTCQGRPFGLNVFISSEKLGKFSSPFVASLKADLSGRPDMTEVARAQLMLKDGGAVAISSIASSSITVPVSSSVQEIISSSQPPASLPITINTASAASVEGMTDTGIENTQAEEIQEVKQAPVKPISPPAADAQVVFEKTVTLNDQVTGNIFSWPRHLTFASDGSLWMVDSQSRKVFQLNDEGKLMKSFGKKGKTPGALGFPIFIAVSGGEVFVSDTSAHTVHVYDCDGIFQRKIGTWGTNPGQMDLPHGLKSTESDLWVTDRGNKTVTVFSKKGDFKKIFSKKGDLPGFVSSPVDIKIGSQGIWILESPRGKLQLFSDTGKFIGGFVVGTRDASALDIDPWGNLWVVDSEGGNVLKLSNEGKVLSKIASPNPSMKWIPTAVSVREDGLIAVSDGQAKSVHFFRIQ